MYTNAKAQQMRITVIYNNQEIAELMATHALVQDVAVFGIPNEEFGEEVKAAVELVPGATVDPALAETLAAFCREHLAGYKTPKSFDFVVDMPRHETGKLYSGNEPNATANNIQH